MSLTDISVPITERLVTWKDGGKPRLERTGDLAKGDTATTTRLTFSAHTGTHMDAPAHFVAGGGNMDSIDLDVLVGPARVIVLEDLARYTADDLDPLVPAGTERLLVKTRNSRLWDDPTHPFASDYVAGDRSAAELLVARGVRLLGVDYLSAGPIDDNPPVHRLLLGAGIVLLEGLDLRAVAAGEYELICLPLKLPECEAAPCRAALRSPATAAGSSPSAS